MAKVTKPPGKAVVKWDEELANLAKESTKGIKVSTSKFLSIRGGKLSFSGEEVEGNELDAVILGWVFENQYYDERFDPNTPQSPACYAFGTDTSEMEPHEEAPRKQSSACEGCPMNEWDSADSGGGKACKNVVRIALIASSDLDNLKAAEIVYMKIPVMSVKNFTTYVKKSVADILKRPYWAVVTKISVVPDPRSQVKVMFSVEEPIEDSELFAPLKDLWEKTMEGIDFPYPQHEAEDKPVKKKKPSKFARK